jgi:hypothetical protein
VRNNTTGALTAVSGPEVPITRGRYQPATAAGGFFQAIAGLKNIAGDNTSKRANTKLLIDQITKGASASRDRSEGTLADIRATLAGEILKKGGTPAEAAAATTGRSAGASNAYEFIPGLDPSKINVGDKRTGIVTTRTAQPPVTEQAIADTMKARKMTREQVLARLKAEGRM